MKKQVEVKLGVPVSSQRLVFRGKPLTGETIAVLSTCLVFVYRWVKSLAPGGFDYSLKLVNFKLISTINI